MLRLLILLALLLVCVPAWAGPEMLLAVRGLGCTPAAHTSSTINAITDIASGEITDTGTATFGATGMCPNTLTVHASCDATGGYGSNVYLMVNEVQAGVLTCVPGMVDVDYPLTATVSGSYSARVYGTRTGTASFSAWSFSLPTP